MRRVGRWVLTLVVASCAVLGSAHAQEGATRGEWRSYGGDTGSTKYSPLDQITAGNFKRPRTGVALEDARHVPDCPQATPREITSRSASVSARGRAVR